MVILCVFCGNLAFDVVTYSTAVAYTHVMGFVSGSWRQELRNFQMMMRSISFCRFESSGDGKKFLLIKSERIEQHVRDCCDIG